MQNVLVAAVQASLHKTCASCGVALSGSLSPHSCAACGAPQPLVVGAGRDPFEAFQVPRRFAQDRAALQKRLLELSRALHPDRFVRASPELRQASLDRMGLVNEAYRLLTDREAVRELLLSEAGFVGKGTRTAAELDFAERWFEIQEQVMDSESPQELVADFEGEIRSRLQSIEAQVKSLEDRFDSEGSSGEALRELSTIVQSANTMRSLFRDVERLKARVGLG